MTLSILATVFGSDSIEFEAAAVACAAKWTSRIVFFVICTVFMDANFMDANFIDAVLMLTALDGPHQSTKLRRQTWRAMGVARLSCGDFFSTTVDARYTYGFASLLWRYGQLFVQNIILTPSGMSAVVTILMAGYFFVQAANERKVKEA